MQFSPHMEATIYKLLQRADRENIPSYHLSARKSGSEETLAKEILDVLSDYKIGMIFNIHPAPFPKFGRNISCQSFGKGT